MTACLAPAPHTPVLLPQVLQHTAPGPGRSIMDCTCGAGGHSLAFLQAGAEVVAVDRDPQARAIAQERLQPFASRLQICSGTYASAARQALAQGRRFDAVLADLGVSSMQLDDLGRGFGIRSQADADMRMGEGATEGVLDFIDRNSLEDLAQVIRDFGEERMAGRVARHLKEARARGERSAAALAAAVRSAIPGRHLRHPALRTFQALRIAVNHELDELAVLLDLLPRLLRPGGRAVLISFHSLEDRLVKNSFRQGLREGLYAAISKKVITAPSEEVAQNRRAASAKLRWAQGSDSVLDG